MVKEDGPWELGDEIDEPYPGNRYIESMVDVPNKVDVLNSISQEWISEIADMTSPFSDSERAMLSFIVNTLIEGNPDQRIESMSCTIGDVQAAVASEIHNSMVYDLNSWWPGNPGNTGEKYDRSALQFISDPRQPGLQLIQRIPCAIHVYKQLGSVEFEVSNTSHGENVMMGKTPALPITVLDPLAESNDRATWWLGMFIHYTLKQRDVKVHFLGETGGLRLGAVINRTIK